MSEESTTAAYSARADEYTRLLGSIEDTHAQDRELIAAWADTAPGLIVDAGCGPGHWAGWLHGRGQDVVGIDLVPEFVAVARERFPQVRFERSSLADVATGEPAGGILAWYSLIHTPPEDVLDILVGFHTRLTPGGTALLGFFEGPSRQQFHHAVAPAYYWSLEELSALLREAGFAVGATHRRTSAEHRPHAAILARRPAR
ncbi:class I SAM-dependent methyltransferase [Zhihengliuella halotolerans]|uniref:Methyltransferase family protein n=1 Tax=Zhihengliuella halotolerans TaxID=370736 RepID=A0A4V2GA50_9MICC|nr:class I SAM-dependent methyltransferase [Zhihengliuella halotolerans]RZU62926.1 methyltransferase family protein [Zhihengliuella halotolerans]